MNEQIRRKDFDQICRLCLEYASDETKLFPLYISDANIPGFYGRFLKEFKESLPEVIATCIGIGIDPSEKLPLKICSSCERQLISSNQFRQTCLKSNEILQKLQQTDDDDDDDFGTQSDTPPVTLEYPELIIVDNIKDEFKVEHMESDSSCDSVWEDTLSDNFQPEINVNPVDNDEKPRNKDVIKTAGTKRSTTIPLITPSTPIVPVDCGEAIDSERSQSNKDVPKRTVRHHYVKKPKMCTVCGIIVDRLRDHMRTHPDALEHKCTLCSKKYLTRKGLAKHIRHKHAEDSDQSSCEYEYYYNKNGERTARKPLAKPHKWKRNVAKIQRNFGQRYISAKGIERPEKKLKEPCNSICRIKCTTKIAHSQREEIFKRFWNIADLTQKRAFLIRHIEKVIPKYRRSNGLRSLNYAYFFEVEEKRIQVCKTFFIRTLDISHVFIKTAINKFNSEKGHLEGERRGKCKNLKK